MYIYQSNNSIIQNLRDAGCDESTIAEFMENLKYNKIDASLNLLAIHRKSLLNQLHKKQKQIDCLDYLVYIIKREKL